MARRYVHSPSADKDDFLIFHPHGVGIGARRTEVTEDVSVLSSSTVFFRAGHEDETAPTTFARRAMSLGPGIGLDLEADDEGALSDDEYDEDHADESRRIDHRDQGTMRTLRGRRLSADQNFFQRHIVEHTDDAAIPTPPYTPRPDGQSSVPGSPLQTLQELRNALRSDLAASRSSVPSRMYSKSVLEISFNLGMCRSSVNFRCHPTRCAS